MRIRVRNTYFLSKKTVALYLFEKAIMLKKDKKGKKERKGKKKSRNFRLAEMASMAVTLTFCGALLNLHLSSLSIDS